MESDRQYLTYSPPGKLRGAKGRVITGGLNIAFGIADLVIAIIIKAHVVKLEDYVYGTDGLLRGIGFIILSITAGCFGIYSGVRSGRKCQIVTYMVLSIVLAVFTGLGVYNSTIDANNTGQYIHDTEREVLLHPEYTSDVPKYVYTLYTFLIINCIVNAFHCVVAIAGAASTSFICCVPDTRASEQPMPLPQQPQLPMGIAAAAMPPAYTTYPAMK